MDINELYEKIIPPSTYEYRRDLDNTVIIDGLNDKDKKKLEELLITDLKENDDILIIETLAYLNSKKAINIFLEKLNSTTNPVDKIMISHFIYKLDDTKKDMIEIAYNSFKLIDENSNAKITMFYYLSYFKNEKLNTLIREYFNHDDYLISNNAKKAIKLQRKKKWWEFW